MGCPDESALLDFAGGLLSGDAAQAIEAHIDGCPDCRALVAEAARHEPAPTTPGVPSAPGGEAGGGFTRLGRYLVLEMLDAGGMGVVYAAFDPELERKVALKVLRPEALGTETATQAQGRLLREAQAMAKLSHPNVATVFDVGTVGEQVFLAMELVDGGTLGDWMAGGPRPWREVVELFLAAGRGLAAAHAAGLVHRDFKPGNVLLGTDGRVRVTDFGLARPVVLEAGPGEPGAEGPSASQSTTGGTPAYMAPEQLTGGAVDARSDQFSFCVALWEALYGERPFGGKTFQEHRAEVLAGHLRPPPPRAAVPAWLTRVVSRGLQVEPAARYPFLETLLDALGRSRRGARARRWGLAGGAALLLASSVALLQLGQSRAGRCAALPADGMSPELSAKALAARQAFEARLGEGGFARVQQALAAQARALAQAQQAQCAAGSGVESAGRERCLRDRQAQLLALVEALPGTDVSSEVAAEAFARLLPAQGCLAAVGAERRWPVLDEKGALAAGAVHEAEALRLLGRPAEAAKRAQSGLALAREAGAASLAAWAELTLALSTLEAYPASLSEPLLHRAAASAEAAGEPLAAARAWSAILAELVSRSDPGAESAALHAQAFLDAAGGDASIGTRIEASRARALAGSGEDAAKAAEKAVALAEQTGSALALSIAHAARAEVSCAEGRCSEAVSDAAQAAQELETAQGKSSPQTLAGILSLARLLREGGRPADARALLERGKAAGVSASAAANPYPGLILLAMARTEVAAGDAAAAERRLGEAKAALGPVGERDFPPLVVAEAQLRRLQERCAESLPSLERARATALAQGVGEEAEEAARETAECQLSLAKPELALAALDALPQVGLGSPALAFVRGRALFERGEVARGRALVVDAAVRGSQEAKRWLQVHPEELPEGSPR